MSQVFLKIVNMSISASWLVLAVLLLRLVLKKAPKWIRVLLWGLVAVRLLCPASFETAFSLIPSVQTISPDIMLDVTPEITSGISSLDTALNPIFSEAFAPDPWASANPLQIWIPVLTVVWLVGLLTMVLYTAVSYWRLSAKVATAVRLEANVFESEFAESPFVLGMFRPKIYLPYSLGDENRAAVIAHEKAHIARKDHWWKPLGFLVLAIHWFNPILWLSYILLCRDIELACDEKVVRTLSSQEKADYTQALVSCSVSHFRVAACPLAFGEVGVKTRVKAVLHYKKPAFWLLVAAVILCLAVAVCFLTDPFASVRNPSVQEYVPGAEGILGSVDKESLESLSPDFAIGADRYGRAVFKDPYKAFNAFKALYAEGIALIRQENDLPPITRTKYSAYKKLGWQATTGTAEAQTQAAFVSKFLDIYENSFTKEVPSLNTEIPTTDATQPFVRKWFDDTAALYQNGEITLEIPEIPSVIFRATAEKITANGETVIEGMPINSAYFCDLNGDGVPELCTSTFMGSGIIDSRVVIYDFAQMASYELADRGLYDFYLELNAIDGCLYVQRRNHNSEVVLEYGKLIFQNDTLKMGGAYLQRLHYLYGRILEIVGDFYLVEPAQGSMLAGVVNKIMVPMEKLIGYPEPQVGDILEIKYDGYLAETYPAQIRTVYSIRVSQQHESNQRSYYLTVAEKGVYSIEYSSTLGSGGCQNADGSAFNQGEKVWLEGLDGLTDLRGVTVDALDEQGNVLCHISVEDTKENQYVNTASSEGWVISLEE